MLIHFHYKDIIILVGSNFNYNVLWHSKNLCVLVAAMSLYIEYEYFINNSMDLIESL